MTRAILNLIALLLLAGCGAKPFFTGGGTLLISPTSVSLSVGGTQQFTVTGGKPPYTYSVASSALGNANSTGLLTTAWTSGLGSFTVRDAVGQNASAQVSIASGALALGNGGTTAAALLLQDSQGKRLAVGRADADLGGRVYGSLSASMGVFVAKTNDAGQVEWVTQVASTGGHVSDTVALLDSSGAVFISGDTAGVLATATQYGTGHGNRDTFLMKVNSDGTLAWASQVGPGAFSSINAFLLPQFDSSGNTILAGTTSGDIGGTAYSLPANPISSTAYVMAFASNGTRTWAAQMGGGGAVTATLLSSFDVGTDGSTYVTGITDGNQGGTTLNLGGGTQSPFAAYFDSSGVRQWATQILIGNSAGGGRFLRATDGSSGSYLTFSNVQASLAGASFVGSHGATDVALIKLNSSGGLAWVKQIGGGGATVTNDGNFLQSTDGLKLYLSGETGGTLGGTLIGPARGLLDGFLVRLDQNGTLEWNYELGAGAGTTTGLGTALGTLFNPSKTGLALTGQTNGSLGTQVGSHGTWDVYVANFSTASGYAWTKQLGGGGTTTTDLVYAPLRQADYFNNVGNNFQYTADAIYIAGTSTGSFGGLTSGVPGGTSDYVAKFGLTGALTWVNQFTVGATATLGLEPSIVVQSTGEVFMSDRTNASLTGLPPKAHGTDTVIIKFDANGVWQ